MSRLFLPLLLVLAATAQAVELRQPLPEAHALVGVRVVTEPGNSIDNATVVVRDGVIEAVGADVAVPADAAVIEFEAAEDQPPVTVYPGLIEPYLVLESKAGSDDQEGEAGNDDAPAAATPGRHPLIAPDRRLSAADWDPARAEALRAAGFTTALLAPGQGLLRGRSLIANLGDGGLAANLLAEDFAQHAHLDEKAPGGAYPQSLMGSVALFRQSLLDAAWQQRARAAWQRNPAQQRPDWRLGVDALAPVLNGEQALVFEADDTLDSLRILKLVDPDIDLVLVGHGREYQRLSDFPRKPMHILPLDLPQAPAVEDEGNRDVSLEELRHWQHAPANPARLIEAGFPLLLTTWKQSKPADLFAALARAIEAGLTPEQALAALTTAPAEWLGIADRAGRIAPGYMANLVVVNGELLVEKPAIAEVWIDGRRFELASVEPPEVDPAGTWALTLAFGGMGDVEGELVLNGPPTGMQGTLTIMGNEVPLSEARVSGKTLTVKIDSGRFGQGGATTINLEIDGESGRGSGSGPFGEFSVRGRKSGGPGGDAANTDAARGLEVQS